MYYVAWRSNSAKQKPFSALSTEIPSSADEQPSLEFSGIMVGTGF